MGLLLAACHLGGWRSEALILTNGPDANVTAPTNSMVGWQFCSDGGSGCFIAPRVFASVAHVPVSGVTYRGKDYHVSRIIEPKGVDLRFTIVDRDVPAWAPVYIPTAENLPVNNVWISAGGVGAGRMVGGTNIFWGGEHTKRRRWCGSDLLLMVEPFNYFVWRNSQCCAGNGDSGGAVFTSDGRFIGPIKFGDQPFVLNTFNSGGVPVYKFLHLVAEYMPSKTNAPAGGIPPDKAKAVTP